MTDIGKDLPAEKASGRYWVQTERAAHEAWEKLIARAPMAARLVHLLVAHMSQGNAVVASQSTLGELLGRQKGDSKPVHRNTVRNAIQLLVREHWIEVVEIGGKGGALGYVVNSRVAWHGRRDNLRYARFSAEVIASESEQGQAIDERPPLKTIPTIMRGETPLPTGSSDTPPSQLQIDGLEPVVYRDNAGHLYEHDPQTGELQQRIDDY